MKEHHTSSPSEKVFVIGLEGFTIVYDAVRDRIVSQLATQAVEPARHGSRDDDRRELGD